MADAQSDRDGILLAQMFSTLVMAQNSCPVHERCDSSCDGRIGGARYVEQPDGTRSQAVDLRAQLAASPRSAPAHQRTEPSTISETTPPFKYQDLADPNSMMRLLKVKQAVFRADPLDCELVEVVIGNAPAYGALSYCWGEATNDCKILCNYAIFHARPSLEGALKRLRAGFKPGQIEAYLWADALCINQQNITEKGAQIAHMDKIYLNASTVYVDLGGIEDQRVQLNGMSLQWDRAGGMGLQDTVIRSDDPHHPLTYKTIFHALSQPWFSRTWVIQEVTLARRVKYMFHGRIFTQQDMDAVLDRRALHANPSRSQELMTTHATMMGFLNYTKMLEMRGLWRAGRWDSLYFLQLTRDFVASEPKDKIFGLLALVLQRDRQAIGSYSQSVQAVYRNFAALQVSKGKTMSILDCAGLQRRKGTVPDLPSWVPDWTAQRPTPKPISTLRPTPYATSRNSQLYAPVLGDLSDSDSLSVEGYIIDSIRIIVHHSAEPATIPSKRSDRETFLSFHDCVRPVYDTWFPTIAQRQPIEYWDQDDTFARLLLMDDTYTGHNAITYSSPILDPAATYRAAICDSHLGPPSPATGKMGPVETFRMQVETTTGERSFAITRDEGYVALVPGPAEEGDVVAVICGATVPYVLRPVVSGNGGEMKYLLVGDAYVQGIMGGESWVRFGAGRVKQLVLV